MSSGAKKIPHFVTEDECETMRTLADDGVDDDEIAVQMARTARTVRKHLDGRCKHIAPNYASTATEDELIAAIHELAAEIKRVPTLREWRRWGDKPHNSDTVVRKLGGTWRSAIKQTDLPLVAKGSTKAIRAAAYQKPELCANPAERTEVNS